MKGTGDLSIAERYEARLNTGLSRPPGAPGQAVSSPAFRARRALMLSTSARGVAAKSALV